MTTITFLGSGSWQGIPAPFCDDSISRSVRWGDKDFRFRTSLHIKTETGKNILIEATPDVRLQSWKFGLPKPDAIIVSHWHWDHLFGLLDLDWFAQKDKLCVYGNTVTQHWKEKSMSHINTDFISFESLHPFVIDNIKITPIPVNHVDETHGFIFENLLTGKKFVYLADFHSIPKQTLEMIKDAEYVTIDATYLASDIVDDPTHIQNHNFAETCKDFDGSRSILVNIGSYHDLSHDDLQKRFADKIVAFDGMKVNI